MPPVDRETGPLRQGPATESSPTISTDDFSVDSAQVSWWDVHLFVVSTLDAAGSWPMVGSPAWCALPDDDPRKVASLLDAAQHWALRVDTCQQAQSDASRTISAGEDWRALAREIQRRRGVYIPRKATCDA